VIEFAVDEARRLNHQYIGTEHLLLGLVREEDGIAAGALESLGVNLEKVRTETIRVLSQSGAPHVVSQSRFAHTHFIQSMVEVGEEWFDTFTVQVSRVLSIAEEEARRFQHNSIDTEHLLLALTRERKGVAASVSSNLGVDLNKVRSAVEFILSVKVHIVPEQVGLTPQVKKVIELAVDEARLLNHHYVGIEHLLLGLIREEKGTAASVLESLGVTLEQARIETMRVLSQPALLQKMEVPPQLKDALEALDTLLRAKEAALLHQEYSLAAELTAREVNLRDRIAKLESDWYRERDNKESGQKPGEEKTISTQQPIQDDDDKVQELSQTEKDFLQTLGVFSQDDRDRFEKFTVRARRVLRFSREEAERFQHNYIGTEHLLLGLVREGEGVAAKVLSNLGVELNKVRSAVEFIIGRGDRIVLGEIGLTPRAKKVIELAVDEARRLNHHYIGTGHLLLGLVREGEGIAAGVLESLGVHLGKVRTETIRVLNQQKDS
jgi:ATP-dependent Clp protease ATP-binding subunit ClpA